MGKNNVQFSIEEVKQYIKEIGYKLLNKEYFNNNQKLILRDIEGYLYFTPLNRLRCGNKPLRFHKSNPYTIRNINLWIEINFKPFKLLSIIYKGNNKKLQWQCLKEDCSEIFEASWGHIQSGKGCGFCHGLQVGLSNCLATLRPDLAKEWHPTKNGNLTPFDVTLHSNINVWWKCSKDHEWESSPNERTEECPYCSNRRPSSEYNLLLINPKLCEEWNYEKNDKLPSEYTPNSAVKVWWNCKINNKHVWEAHISDRNKGHGCLYCTGRLPSEDYNLLINNPELCKEWNYNKNDKNPEEYTPVSGKSVWWKCSTCNHEWPSTISKRTSMGRGCPECGRNKGDKHWNWKGGITSLHNYLRSFILQWKKDSMFNCNYKCVVTGEKFNSIHHLYSFSNILSESLNELNIPIYQSINNYSDLELELIENKILEVHYRYPLGVCLTDEIHMLFHTKYGKGDNTPEQWEEFVNNKLYLEVKNN